MTSRFPLCAALILFAVSGSAWAEDEGVDAAKAPSADAILQRVLDADTWGLAGADVRAKITLRDRAGKTTRELGFNARSLQYAAPLSKSLIRFIAPKDLVGVGFLQIQKKGEDDERHLYLPDLKKTRRITGKLRSQAFMGTDFSYADIDRRDIRDATVKQLPDVELGKVPCFHLDATPSGSEREYGRVEIWVRKDNFLPIKWHLYNAAGEHVKTLETSEVKRINNKWFLIRSVMSDLKAGRSTELYLEKIDPSAKIPDDEFTVRNLEKS